MAQVATAPNFLPELQAAISQQLPGAQIEVERVPGLDVIYVRLLVLSAHFEAMDFESRHKLVWSLAKDVLSKSDMDRVISILPLTPNEVQDRD